MSQKKNKIPKLNLLSNIDDKIEEKMSELDKPNLTGPRSPLDYIDLIFEKAWRIWALLLGGLILIWLGFRK